MRILSRATKEKSNPRLKGNRKGIIVKEILPCPEPGSYVAFTVTKKLCHPLDHHDPQPLACLAQYGRPGNSLTFLANTKAKNNQVLQVRCLLVDDFRGSYHRHVRLLRTTRFHSGDLISLRRQFLAQLLNILTDNC